jgi:hypothetical protein
MSQHCHFEASRSLATLEQDSTLIAMIEMSQSKWLVAALVPGVERQPLKKLDAQEEALLKLLHRWRNEAGQARAKRQVSGGAAFAKLEDISSQPCTGGRGRWRRESAAPRIGCTGASAAGLSQP